MKRAGPQNHSHGEGSEQSSVSLADMENMPLEDQLTNRKLQELQEIFEEADEDGGGGLDMEEFRTAMRHAMGEHLTDDDLDLIFMKVDTNCDGTVDWDEYLNYMLLEYTEKDAMNTMVKDKPLPRDSKPVNNLHDFQRHHDSIVKIQMIPNLVKVKNVIYKPSPHDKLNGRYMTMTKEGVLNFWNMELGHMKTQRLTSPDAGMRKRVKGSTSIWVTEMVCMANFNMIAVATSSASLTFYELVVGGSIRQNLQITEMEIFITAMDYWVDPRDPTHSLLLWGDGRGNICALRFFGCDQVCVLHPHLHKNARPKLKFSEVLYGKCCGLEAYRLPVVHNEFVLQVKYCAALGFFVSCSGDGGTSLYMGDLLGKRRSYFKASKGTTTFDYSTSNNIIVSAGKDAIIRVWNPYVPRKPVMILQGHTAAITHIIVNESKEHIISISENKDILIFDLDTQTCIQSIFKKWVKLGPRPVSGAYFNEARQALVLATNELAIWEHMEEDLHAQLITSHHHPMTCVLYNSLFRQVVSGSTDSLVCVWDIITGERIIQFYAHRKILYGTITNIEISVMAFDPTLRRMITGARDGSVKIWNFNNGACLRELDVDEKLEVTGIVCPSHRIITAGWNHCLTVFMDTKDDEDESSYRWPVRHKDDILTLAYSQPSTVASASYDGDIMLWSLETGYVTTMFNASKGARPVAGLSTVSQFQTGKKSTQEECDGESEDTLSPLPNPGGASGHGVAVRRRSSGLRLRGPSESTTRSSGPGRLRRTSLLPPPAPTLEPCSVEVPRWGGKKTNGKSVEKIIFLENRRTSSTTATLVSAESGGWIRFWSVHHEGGLMGQWNAAHQPNGMVVAMTTDVDNEFIITGDDTGYIKVWDVLEYCQAVPVVGRKGLSLQEWHSSKGRHFRMFVIDESLQSKGSDQSKHRPPDPCTQPARTWKVPPLLTSFRGHLQGINDLCYVDKDKLIVTCSDDCSLRMWTLEGLYVGIFGQNVPWRWSPAAPTMETNTRAPSRASQTSGITKKGQKSAQKKRFTTGSAMDRNLPPDVRRVASATTLKMFYGGTGPLHRIARNILLIWIPMILRRKEALQRQIEQSPDQQQQQQQGEQLTELVRHLTPKSSLEVHETDTGADEDTNDEEGKSVILGKSYKTMRKHQPLPKLQNPPRIFKTQCAVYSSLPYFAMEAVDDKLRPPQTILDIQDRQQAIMNIRRKRESHTRQRVVRGGRPGTGHSTRSSTELSTGDSCLPPIRARSNKVLGVNI